MANNINLATFEFDTTRLESSLNSLQDTMIRLKKEQSGYNQVAKETQKEIDVLVKAQRILIDNGQLQSDAYNENKVKLAELNKVQAEAIKGQQNIALQISRVKAEVNATNTQLKAYQNTQAQQTSLIELGNAALSKQILNINQARASNTELLRVRNQLNPSIAEEAKMIALLNAKMNENNAFIKANVSEYEKQKIGIGDYKTAIKEAFGELDLFNGKLGDAKRVFDALTPAFAGIKQEFRDAINQIRGVGAATEGMSRAQQVATATTGVLSGALKLFRVALISTGIGAIVVALGALIGYLSGTQEGIDKVTSVTRPLQAVLQAVWGVVKGLGGSMVEAFTNPKKSLEDLYNFIKGQVINRFVALHDIIQGIVELDFDKISESAAQAVTGVDNVGQKIATASRETAAFLAEAARKGAEIDRIQKEINKSQLEYNRGQIEANDLIDQQQLKVKNTALSFKERAAAAEEIIRITEEQGQKEAAILQLKLKQLKLEQELKGAKNLTNEDKQKEIDLLVEIDAAEDRGLEARLENSRVLSGLQKEQRETAKKAHDERMAQIKEQQEAAIKAMQTELEFYIASQGSRKKSMGEQLEIDKETMRQSLEIAKAEFEAKKLTRREYELEVLNIQNEFARKQVEATMANADIETQLLMLNLQRKIDANKFYSDAVYNQELDRINKIAEAEAAAQTLRLNNGLISQEEYNLAIAQIDEKQRLANEEATKTREQAKKEQEAANVAIQDELNAERFEYDLALQMERFERKYQQEKEAAIKNGADMEAFEKMQAERRTKIEELVQKNKLNLASSTLKNLTTIMGEQSAVGKAFAIMQTTIDTYQSATAAYKAMAGIPVVGPALGAAAAGAAIVAGIKNVKEIAKTDVGGGGQQRPGYKDGVIGLPGTGSATSDSIDARLSAGESVITARATRMFPNLLSEINQIGGGVGIDGTKASSNALIQNEITSRNDNALLSSEIADAVMVGAQRGTQRGSAEGIKGLSNDRQIQANAYH